MLRFKLIPAEHWRDAETDLSTAVDGTIFLYQPGDLEPRRVVAANEFHEFQPGPYWLWRAEAEGYATVMPGEFGVDPEAEGAEKTVVWPAVPACHVVFSNSRDWQAVSRVDLVSLRYDAVLPVNLRRRPSAWVPVGPLLVYTVGPGGITGISKVKGCEHFSEIVLDVPPPPEPHLQAVLLHVLLPEEQDSETANDLLVAAMPDRGGAQTAFLPTARVRRGNRTSLFFLGLPAEAALRITASHPATRSRHVVVEPLGGSVRELEELQLAPRWSLEFNVDYQPWGEHKAAAIEVFHCSTRLRRVFGDVSADCNALEYDLPLSPGLQEYRVDGLDDGQHVFQARIDDEVVPGLGHGFWPYLAEDEPPLPASTFLLKEFEVFGHILVDEEPVSGVVSLTPRGKGEPVRRFPTDEELFYRLRYFGREVWRFAQLPEEIAKRPASERFGLAHMQLAACAEGFCSHANIHTVILGGGRFDWELPAGQRMKVRVVDAETRDPIAGADVFVKAPDRFLVFDHGTIHWEEPVGMEPVFSLTDLQGTTAVSTTSTADEQWVTVSKAGYERYQDKFSADTTSTYETLVELVPEREMGSLRFHFPDGEPVSHAFLLVLKPDGTRDIRCSRKTTRLGILDFEADCLEASGVFLFHPQATLSLFHGSQLLRRTGDVDVQRAPRRPVALRILDSNMVPISDVRIELVFRSGTLGTNDLLAAATQIGFLPFQQTDENGEVVLRGVDPTSRFVPDVRLLIDDDETTYSLDGYPPGETVELIVD